MAEPTPDNPNDHDIAAPLCSIYRRYLRAHGLRMTRSRAQVLDAVIRRRGLFEIEQLRFGMRRDGHAVSKATVYRIIGQLVEAGIIRRVLLDSSMAQYEVVYGREPTDYLIDLESQRIIEFHDDEIQKIRDQLCGAHGLRSLGHRLVIYGVSTPEQP